MPTAHARHLGHPAHRVRPRPPDVRLVHLAFPGRQAIALCGDGGFTMLGPGDLLTQVQLKARVVNVIFNNGMLDFVNISSRKPVPSRSGMIS